jgi:hypothetical protein
MFKLRSRSRRKSRRRNGRPKREDCEEMKLDGDANKKKVAESRKEKR